MLLYRQTSAQTPDNNHSPCPCGSGESYARCCQVVISGHGDKLFAEALMRARFTAYRMRNVEFLLGSWHPSTRPPSLDLNDDILWRRLHVLASDSSDDYAFVEFVATAWHHDEQQPQAWLMHERSRFQRVPNAGDTTAHKDRWQYLDGKTLRNGSFTKLRIGRQSPCPCGSGKKSKHCCATPPEHSSLASR